MPRRLAHAELASLADAGRWDELWLHALPMARAVVSQMRRAHRVPAHLAEDVLQAAYLAAGVAVRVWRPLDATLYACVNAYVRRDVGRLTAKEKLTASLDEEGEDGTPVDQLAYADPPAGYDDPLAEAARLETESSIRAAVAGLESELDREVLRAVYGLYHRPLTVKEYARMAGLSERTAKTRLAEAKQRLAARLQGVSA